ncbi:Chagasin family peptidase inhibitor I42 [Friedmanniella luteola]|uniref:Chagasin family peptidase inhibitor I42 n=1 Tax=Friedmanniella luteola TaxID=546871 RepID=A0A1H1VG73_9ACTN|nr:protease inhibitor I42 family protein [Friedmanniella luteola]SDS83685.1 Chagasin family peptidase inhibitor I42 [Friedmanniella luteola]
MSELRLAWAQRGQHFEVKPGDLVRVALWGNGTTGFSWSPALPPGSVLEEVTESQLAAQDPAGSGPPRVLGSGSLTEYTFRATRPGKADLVLRYWRGVEAAEDVIYQTVITVRNP